MKITRYLLMKDALALTGILGFLFAAMPKGFASPAEDHINDAVTVSKTWVAQIDAGQYDESYAFGCDAMHDKVPQDTWVKILKALRTPWGPVMSRKQISHIYKPDGYEGSEGEYMLITYDTSFKGLDSATEMVVLKWDGGKWRGAGYNAGPKAVATDDSTAQAPADTTETHTEPHMRPVPQ